MATPVVPAGSIVVIDDRAGQGPFAIILTLEDSYTAGPMFRRARAVTLWHSWPDIDPGYTETFMFRDIDTVAYTVRR